MAGTYADGTAFDFTLCTTPFLYAAVITDLTKLAPYVSNTDCLFLPAVAPAASFSLSRGAPAAGQTVQLTDTSTGTPSSWAWTFGDGGTSALASPGHAWTSAGAFTVSLTATSSSGSSTATRTISVSADPVPSPLFPVVDTGQTTCYGASSSMTCPAAGQPFYGQDAQLQGSPPRYTASADGLTVHDDVPGLTWQQSPDTDGSGTLTSADKLTWAQAQARPAALNAVLQGGFGDWRLPTIKELYSLISFRGTDPTGFSGTDTSVLTPFIDTAYFRFAYGDTTQGERLIDSQYASSNVFVVNPAETGWPKLFGLNLADGRIKGYDLIMPDGVTQKTFFVQLVRGRSDYATNTLADNGDGTVSDAATGLMWAAGDSGVGMTWQEALAWVQANNAASYLGHRDWRLPNAKELHSLVNYANAPD